MSNLQSIQQVVKFVDKEFRAHLEQDPDFENICKDWLDFISAVMQAKNFSAHKNSLDMGKEEFLAKKEELIEEAVEKLEQLKNSFQAAEHPFHMVFVKHSSLKFLKTFYGEIKTFVIRDNRLSEASNLW